MCDRFRSIAGPAAVVLVVVAVVVLGWASPPRSAVVSTDRLGPETGERVADYLARAGDSLSRPAGVGAAQHWALVSFDAGSSADRLSEYAAGLRISQVLYHVAMDRVYTPPVTVPVPAGDAAIRDSVRAAAGWMDAEQPAQDRAARVAATAASRLRAGCACAVGMVVRGRVDRLRGLSGRDGVRAVEALPPDAAAGAFAVAPLLPEYREVVEPGPDDGPVPAA